MNIKNEELIDINEVVQDTWDEMTFGSLIRSLRLSDEISQVELAKKIGVSKQLLSDVEHNRKEVGFHFAKKISKSLGYSIAPMLELIIRDQLKKQKLNYDVTVNLRARL